MFLNIGALTNIFTSEQHGFRKNRSTSTVFIKLLSGLTKMIDDGKGILLQLTFQKRSIQFNISN